MLTSHVIIEDGSLGPMHATKNGIDLDMGAALIRFMFYGQGPARHTIIKAKTETQLASDVTTLRKSNDPLRHF